MSRTHTLTPLALIHNRLDEYSMLKEDLEAHKAKIDQIQDYESARKVKQHLDLLWNIFKDRLVDLEAT